MLSPHSGLPRPRVGIDDACQAAPHATDARRVQPARSLARRLAVCSFVAGLAAALAAPFALAEGTPAPWGTRLPSGSNVQSEIGPVDTNDCDDFVFDVVKGQKITLTVKAITKTFDPLVEMFRGDGIAVQPSDGVKIKSKGLVRTVTFTADRTDTYKLRVLGRFPEGGTVRTIGAYSVAVKLGARPAGKVTGAAPDLASQLRFPIPAMGGASVTATLKFRGKAPVAREFDDPSGTAITGFTGRVKPLATSVSLKGFVLDPLLPFGEYDLVFDTDPASPPTKISLTYSVKPPKGLAARKGKLDRDEPFIISVSPPAGGTNTLVTVNGGNFRDEFKDDAFRVFVGRFELTGVAPVNPSVPTQLRGRVPGGLPFGTYDVRVETATGQSAVKADAFSVVSAPVATSIEPSVGPTDGNFPITITGSGFRKNSVGILIDGALVPVSITDTTATTVTFNAPPRGPGFVTFGVKDVDTQLTDDLSVNSFEYTVGAAIQRVVPSLVPVLGTETAFIRGVNFDKVKDPVTQQPSLHIFVETSIEGEFEDVTPPGGGYLNSTTLQFTAPVRPKGTYDVYLRDVSQANSSRSAIRTLSYYTFENFTAGLALPATGADQFDAWTSCLADFDGDGDDDLFLGRRSNATTLAAAPLTRILRNDGAAGLVDVTSSVMPAITADDDWRADKIIVTQMLGDAFPELVVATNSNKFPAATKSHVRIFLNEPRTSGGAATDRVFRDRTLDYMAPPRTAKTYGYFQSNGVVYVSDNWRAYDMWIGDIDAGTTTQPEIVITHDETKDDNNIQNDNYASGVYCGNYCTTSGSYPIAYAFYWGGSRTFVWEKNGNGGKGRYKFEHNFFPRKSGVYVPQAGPGGTSVKACNKGTPCKGKFPPFLGQRLAVSDIDADGKPDVAVLSNATVTQDGSAISSLQVGLNLFSSSNGSQVTDLTPGLSIFGDLTNDAVAIGHPGYPDGNSYGFVAVSKFAGGGGGPVCRVLRYIPGVAGAPGSFSEVTSLVLPPTTTTDKWQASSIQFLDIEGDGDDDMALLANGSVGAGSSFRILRNVAANGKVGVFDSSLLTLLDGLTSPSEHFEGDTLAIGDMDKDGVFEFVVSREIPTSGSLTRAVKMAK